MLYNWDMGFHKFQYVVDRISFKDVNNKWFDIKYKNSIYTYSKTFIN